MDIELLKEQLNAVHSNYPWATEETAEKLATLSTRNSVKSTALATAIMSLHGLTGSEKLKETISKTADEVRKSTRTTKARIARVRKYTDRFGNVAGSMSGLDAITELTAAGAEALSAGANGLAGFAKNIPGVGIAAKGTAWLTGGIAASAGIMAVFSKLVTQQERELRSMIDLGLVLSDSGHYTKLRGTAAELGMSLKDYSAIMQGTANVLTGARGSLAQGSGELLNMLNNPEFTKRISKFGYAPRDLSMAMADELQQLYEVNEINDLGAADQERVVKSFESANTVSLFVANSLGARKQELLDARKLIRDNANFKQAMFQNQQYYVDTFGEGSQDNIRQFNETFAMITGPLLGETLAAELIQVNADMANNIQYDHSPIQEMSSELIRKMKMLGPGVLEQFIKISTLGNTNKINSDAVTIAETAELVKLIQKGPILEGFNQEILEVGKVRAAALLIEPEMLQMTAEEIATKFGQVETGVDGADDSIDIVGGMSKAFLKAANVITPGFGVTSEVMKVFSDSLEGFASVWTGIFNLGDPNDASGDDIGNRDFDPQDLVSLLDSGNRFITPGTPLSTEQRQIMLKNSQDRKEFLMKENQPLIRERNEINLELAALDVEGINNSIDRAEKELEAAKIDGNNDRQVAIINKINQLTEERDAALVVAEPLLEKRDEVETDLLQNIRLQRQNLENWGQIYSENNVTAEELDFTANASGTANAINSMSPLVSERYLNTVKNFEAQHGSEGYSILISEGYRTMARSNQLKASGVTAASGGHSYHNYGMAGDFLIYKDGNLINHGPAYDEMLATIAKEQGLHAPVSNDGGHFQPVEFPVSVPQELFTHKTEGEDAMTSAANTYILKVQSDTVEKGIVVLENRIADIQTEQEVYSTMYPDGENEALIIELAELEAQLSIEMENYRILEEERSNG